MWSQYFPPTIHIITYQVDDPTDLGGKTKGKDQDLHLTPEHKFRTKEIVYFWVSMRDIIL